MRGALLVLTATGLALSATPVRAAPGVTSAEAPVVTPSPSACVLTPIAPFDVLIAKATVSTVRVVASTAECRAALLAHSMVAATSDKVRLLGRVSSTPGGQLELAFENIEISPSAHGYDWAVASIDGDALGSVSLHLPVVAIETKSLVVSFLATNDDRRQIERPATELIAAARNSDAWLHQPVASPPITNVAVVDLPDRVASPPAHRWRVTSSTWGQSIAFLCHDATGLRLTKLDDKADSRPCRLTPNRIMFAVRRRMKSQLVVKLELWDEQPTTEAAKVVVFVPLAREARVESLPVPLWRVAQIECRYDRLIGRDVTRKVRSSGTLGIDADALTAGQCYVALDFSFVPVSDPIVKGEAAKRDAALRKAQACEAWKELIDLSGPQNLELTVSRGTATTTKQFQVMPGSPTCGEATVSAPPAITTEAGRDGGPKGPRRQLAVDVQIPAPRGAGEEDGPYEVTLRLKGSQEVHYFERTLDEDAIEHNVDAGASFTLRPRGPLSTTWPIRYGASVVGIPFGVRFPARARDVPSSSSPASVHLEGPRTAVMLSVEPWNHDRNRDPWPVPVQAQLGLTLLRAAEKPLDLNVLVGLNFILPFEAKERGENRLAIGLFFEQELMETRSHAIMITANINLLDVARSSGQ